MAAHMSEDALTGASSGRDGRILFLIGVVCLGLFAFLKSLVEEMPGAALAGASPSLLAVIGLGACGVIAAVALGPIGRALAARIAQRPDELPRQDIEQLRAEIENTRLELSEAHERLDFTERLLTEARRQETPRSEA